MSKALIIYYSRTGNTEKMAKAVVEGMKNDQVLDVELKVDIDVKPDELMNYDAMIIGVPTQNHAMTRGIKNLLEETTVKGINLKDKIGAAFGSYGWSGEAPRLALEVMESRLGMKVIKPPLSIMYSPDEKALEECRKLGKSIAELIRSS